MKKALSLLLILLLSLSVVACAEVPPDDTPGLNVSGDETGQTILDEDGHYTSKEDVALYLNLYDKLPQNFITKDEARALGWEANKGNLWDVTDQKSIGGDKFGNREGRLPTAPGRQYYECDINYEGGFRGAERLVYSSDGLVYYTEDHYDSFVLLYGDE